MATYNYTSSTNNVNFVLYSYSTGVEYFSDRAAGSIALHGSIEKIQGLGSSVYLTNPFSNKTS